MIIPYADGSEETKLARLQRILPLLACPLCRGPLASYAQNLICQQCNTQHPVRGGVPVLLPAGVQDAGAVGLSKEELVSRHPYSARAEEIIAAHPHGWVLDLGAGGKLERRKNVVQIDIFRYPSVDVVGSADCLPFLDNAFDAVISQAVFEHLQYPEWAVREVRRVLKPGGIAKIDTAFLQPEHGYPHHFYNATETGLLHWFRDFGIEWSGVEPFQHPKWAMHWFLGVYLDYIGTQQAEVLRKLSVGDLVDTLQRHATDQTLPTDLPAIAALDSMPEQFLRVLAAGVSVHALNPPKHEITLACGPASSPPSLDREREMAQLRAESVIVKKSAAALQERLKLAQDKAGYLAQFYPNASNWVRLTTLWAQPQPQPHGSEAARGALAAATPGSRPFATLVLRPTQISSLLETFFSLVNQIFGGWELTLLTSDDLPAGLLGAVDDLCRLDQRVVAVRQNKLSVEEALRNSGSVRGEYWMQLPEGAALAVNALEEVVTLARNIPGVARIGCDFDRSTPGASDGMRCYTQVPFVAGTTQVDCFDCCFLRLESDAQVPAVPLPSMGSTNDAHIPLSLVHLDASARDQEAPLKASLAYLWEQNHQLAEALQTERLKNNWKLGLMRLLRLQVGRLLRKLLPAPIWARISVMVSHFDRRFASPTRKN